MALIGKLVRVVLRCVVFTGTVGALFLPPSSAIGDPGHCVGISLNTTAPIDVYLNYESFEHLYNDKYVQGGITADEAIGMVHQAMEEWNHSSAGRPLVYKGTTTAIRGTCNYAVVRGGAISGGSIVPWVTSVNAQMQSECSGSSFSIQFASTRSSGAEVPWKTGDPALPGTDMIVTMTHEFGHGLGIGHPLKANSFSVMEFENPNRRELYELDTECAELYYDNGPRSLGGSETFFNGGAYSTTLVGSSGFWAFAPGVTSGGTNSTPNRFRGARMLSSGLYAERYSSGLRFLGSDLHHTAHPPIRIHRRDLPSATRDAIISKRRSAFNYGSYRHEKFLHSIYYSSNGFETSHSESVLFHCSYATGGSCTNSKPVYSARRLTASFDTVSNKTLYAWTDQNRENHQQNNELLIAVGHYDWNLLSKPFSAGVRSDVAPALACKANSAGSRDCMIAYTDIADPTNSVRFRRFDVGYDGTYFYPIFESGFQQVDAAGWQRTASPIGLFHHDGKWWLAIKLALATGNGGIRLYSSTSGDTGTWTGYGSSGYTLTGATVIGDWSVSNYIRWTH